MGYWWFLQIGHRWDRPRRSDVGVYWWVRPRRSDVGVYWWVRLFTVKAHPVFLGGVRGEGRGWAKKRRHYYNPVYNWHTHSKRSLKHKKTPKFRTECRGPSQKIKKMKKKTQNIRFDKKFATPERKNLENGKFTVFLWLLLPVWERQHAIKAVDGYRRDTHCVIKIVATKTPEIVRIALKEAKIGEFDSVFWMMLSLVDWNRYI